MLNPLLLQIFIRLVNAASVQEHPLSTAAKQPLHIVPKEKAKPADMRQAGEPGQSLARLVSVIPMQVSEWLSMQPCSLSNFVSEF